MPHQLPRSQLECRPLVDLTNQISREDAIHVAGGAFGDVYKCRCIVSGSSSLVAVKAPRYFACEDPEENQRGLDRYNKVLRRELGLLKRVEDPNIVPFLGVTRGFGPILATVFPWMSNGTLHSFLKNKGQSLTTTERLYLVHGIGSGLEYLHSIPVFHGDLHTIIVDERHNPRISDFGLACTVGRLRPGLSYLQRLSSTINPGAARWAAPERLSGCEPHPSGDIYSFGCVMFEVLSGDIPWKEKTTYQVVALKLDAHKPPSRPTHIAVGDEHWALMVKCWSSPQRRPTARDVIVVIQMLLSSDNSAKHVTPSLVRRLSARQHHRPQQERADEDAKSNIYLESFNGKVKAKMNVNGNGNINSQSQKTIVIADTSSGDYETTDGEDTEGWTSEEVDAEDKRCETEETRLREAALEAQRQHELFTRVPKHLYSKLNRMQSGLRSQLMNPDPAIFPSNHLHRISRPSVDILCQDQLPQRISDMYAPTWLSASKSAVTHPIAAQIIATSSSKPQTPSTMKQLGGEKNGYRPRGSPKAQETEVDSDDDTDDKILLSQSVAQQKLQALISRRSSGRDRFHMQPIPAAKPPMTPRTTRRQIFKAELSESMRRQLSWNHQVSSNTNPTLVDQRADQGLTDEIQGASARDVKDECKRRTMTRNYGMVDVRAQLSNP